LHAAEAEYPGEALKLTRPKATARHPRIAHVAAHSASDLASQPATEAATERAAVFHGAIVARTDRPGGTM
jgi:hypothetical protein